MLNNNRNNNVIEFHKIEGNRRIQAYQGEVWMADLNFENAKNGQMGERPVVVFNNRKAGLNSPVVSVIPLTTAKKKSLPVHVLVKRSFQNKLTQDSIALVEQGVCIGKERLLYKLGEIDKDTIGKIGRAVEIQWNTRERRVLDEDKINRLVIKISQINKLLKSQSTEEIHKTIYKQLREELIIIFEEEYKEVYGENYKYHLTKKKNELKRMSIRLDENNKRDEITCDIVSK